MSEPRTLQCYRFVDRPYDAVRRLLRGRAPEIFRAATTSAADRAEAVGAILHAGTGAFEVGVGVRIHVNGTRDEEAVAGLPPITHFSLAWEAAQDASLFPLMRADLSISPLTSSETRIEIEGTYRPPLGTVGRLVDAAVGHRVAEASVLRFLEELAEQVRRELAAGA